MENLNLTICENCKTESGSENFTSTIEGEICNECIIDFCCCDRCNDFVKNDETIFCAENDKVYCENCADVFLIFCNDCNEYKLENNSITLQNGEFICDCCSSSYFICDSCCEYFSNSNVYGIDNGTYCEHCYCNNFTYCNNCNNDVNNSDFDVMNDMCDECANAQRNVNIHPYSYKPLTKYFGKGNVFFGMELETETNGNEIPELPENLKELFYFKSDASLDNGIEIVSHPFTFDYFNEIKSEIKKYLDDLRNNGFTSYDTETCGFHLHISKDSFNTWHLYRFLKFFQDNKQFIIKISQRKLEKLKKWASLENEDFSNENIKLKAKDKKFQYSRYCAVNITNKTVEIRIFRGSLNFTSVCKNVEFVESLVNFTRDNSELTKEKYCEFIAKNSQYKNVNNFIQSKIN